MTGIAPVWRTETTRVGRLLEVLEVARTDMDEKSLKYHRSKTSSHSQDCKKVKKITAEIGFYIFGHFFLFQVEYYFLTTLLLLYHNLPRLGSLSSR